MENQCGPLGTDSAGRHVHSFRIRSCLRTPGSGRSPGLSQSEPPPHVQGGCLNVKPSGPALRDSDAMGLGGPGNHRYHRTSQVILRHKGDFEM